jgi:N-acetylglucosamine-6-phosphate deacetylase
MKIQGLYYADGMPISITIDHGMIEKIERPASIGEDSLYFLAPGLIDHQVNGYLSHSFVGGELDAATLRKITEGFWSKGITSFFPTLTTQTDEALTKGFETLNGLLTDQYLAQSIPGFHLEGPYISPEPGFRGVHNPEWIRLPDWQEFERWYNASGKRIREVTIAPEIEGAMEFIRKCRELDIVVAVGHSAALADDINQAMELGATVSTHLGNGCANTIHRHHNPLWPQLADDRLTASIIVDGFHLTREEVRTFTNAKGFENTILVSDLTRLAGMPPGTYHDFGQELVVTPEGAIMFPEENVLAGASFLVTRGVENVIEFTGCSLGEAIDMASKNPARVLGLEDRGEITVGKRADLILFTFNEGIFKTVRTMVGGEVVFGD